MWDRPAWWGEKAFLRAETYPVSRGRLDNPPRRAFLPYYQCHLTTESFTVQPPEVIIYPENTPFCAAPARIPTIA
jgi:hypothetical protein